MNTHRSLAESSLSPRRAFAEPSLSPRLRKGREGKGREEVTHPSIYLTVGGSHRPMDGSLRDQIARWF